MKICADTNVLARAILQDDPAQCRAARKLLSEAALVAVSAPSLCELVWVLRQNARLGKEDITSAIRALLDAGNVVTNHAAAQAGLALLDAGGDFADGVMAHEGRWLGGETFVSFDKKAVTLLDKLGKRTQLLT